MKRKYVSKLKPKKEIEKYPHYFLTYKDFLAELKKIPGGVVGEPVFENSPYHKGRGRPPQTMEVTVSFPEFHNMRLTYRCERQVPWEFQYIRGRRDLKCVTYEGTTAFTTNDTDYSFDQIGVGASFYHDFTETLEAQVEVQRQRILKSVEFRKTALSVPVIGFSISPERLAEYRTRLSDGKRIDFMPSGFGIGYVISTKKMSQFSERCAKEIEEFFQVGDLYMETMDCD